MKLKSIIDISGIPDSEIKIHCASGNDGNYSEAIEKYSNGEFKEWQEWQNSNNLNRKYILSLGFLRPNEWLFLGFYECLSLDKRSDGHFYDTMLTPFGSSLEGEETSRMKHESIRRGW